MKNSIRQVFLSEGKHEAVKKAMELDPKLKLIDAIEMVERIPKEIAEENKPKDFKPADSNPIDFSNISLGKGLLMILIGSIFFIGAMIYSSSKSPPPAPSPQASASIFPSSEKNEAFMKWCYENTAVTDIHIDSATMRVTLSAEKYTTTENVESIAVFWPEHIACRPARRM
jgi:hypothetical protein